MTDMRYFPLMELVCVSAPRKGAKTRRSTIRGGYADMINPDTPRQIAMAVKAYAQKYPYIKEGIQLFTVRGPVRVKAVTADLAGRITVECADGKRYDGAYFGLYASRSNAPDAVVSAYDAATRLTWKQPIPQPLMSPDDLSIAPYARQSYLERYNSTEQ